MKPPDRPASDANRFRRRFLRNPVGVLSALVLAALVVVAVVSAFFRFAGIDVPFDPNAPDLAAKLLPPGPEHLLGTDHLGRDVLSRVLHGSYVSLLVGFVSVAVSLTIGVGVGAVAGYARGWIDGAIMRVVDAVMCFPAFLLILTAVALLGPSLTNIILVIALVSWTGPARLVRAEFLTLRESEYVRAARGIGQTHSRIVFRHILPNAAAPIVVAAVLGVPVAILTEASLSFLGVGVQPPQATWGSIIADGRPYFLDAWWVILFPGLAILVTTLSFYLFGDALRQAAETRSGGIE
jgi:peptide/nickel transport system permease protein